MKSHNVIILRQSLSDKSVVILKNVRIYISIPPERIHGIVYSDLMLR